VLLILRDLTGLRTYTRGRLLDPNNADGRVTELLRANELDTDDAISLILNTTVCRALAYYDFALQTGDPALVDIATGLLAGGLRLAADSGTVSCGGSFVFV